MRFTSSIGMILLSVYLILGGLTILVAGVAIPPVIMGAMAIGAGIFILIGR